MSPESFAAKIECESSIVRRESEAFVVSWVKAEDGFFLAKAVDPYERSQRPARPITNGINEFPVCCDIEIRRAIRFDNYGF